MRLFSGEVDHRNRYSVRRTRQEGIGGAYYPPLPRELEAVQYGKMAREVVEFVRKSHQALPGLRAFGRTRMDFIYLFKDFRRLTAKYGEVSSPRPCNRI